jgi:hypothetical protein
LIMAILKLVIWNSPLAKPSRKGDKFFDHMGWKSRVGGAQHGGI